MQVIGSLRGVISTHLLSALHFEQFNDGLPILLGGGMMAKEICKRAPSTVSAGDLSNVNKINGQLQTSIALEHQYVYLQYVETAASLNDVSLWKMDNKNGYHFHGN